jgi:hypothetical protein
MKRMLFIFGVFGIVAFASAQTGAPVSQTVKVTGMLTLSAQTSDSGQTSETVKMTAKGATADKRLPSVLLTDTVEMVFPGGITVTADEALVNPLLGSVELRGNVRLVAPPKMFSNR